MSDDVSRRRFFHRFTDDAVSTAVTFAGVAGELQRASAEIAGIVAPEAVQALPDEVPPPAPGASPWAAPYHEEAGRLLIPDVRPSAAPGAVRSCGTAVDVGHAMRDGLVRGAPVASQLAALALAMTAEQLREVRPWVRRNALRDAAAALSEARVSSAELRATMARLLGAWLALGELHPDGPAVASAVRAEAEAVLRDGITARRTMGEATAATITQDARPDPLRLLLHGETGVRAAGAPGTALAALEVIHRSGRSLHVWLAVTSERTLGPGSVQADLVALGIPHRLVDGEAVGALVRVGAADGLLLATECVAANGDLAADPGAASLALLAARHGLPVHVCGTPLTIDAGLPDGTRIVTGAAGPGDRPLVDIVDADLITSLTTGGGR